MEKWSPWQVRLYFAVSSGIVLKKNWFELNCWVKVPVRSLVVMIVVVM